MERTRAIILASLENDVFPVLGSTPIADVTPADIRNLVQGIEARGAAETAGRVFQRLRSIFRYAIAHDVIKTDPTYPLKPAEIFKPRKVKHRGALSERDVPIFLQRLAAYEGDPTTLAALTLLTLTVPRPGELRRAWWNEIDADRALWRVPSITSLPRTAGVRRRRFSILGAVKGAQSASTAVNTHRCAWLGRLARSKHSAPEQFSLRASRSSSSTGRLTTDRRDSARTIQSTKHL